MTDVYRENYERIAADHLAHWRETGVNPWQSAVHVEAVGSATAEVITRLTAPGSAVLDAGCAMGDLMERIPADRARFGIDLSAEYLEVARSRGVDTVQGRLEAMPYADASFDLVACVDVLEHVLDEKAVLRECLRVLRPGGALVVRVPEEESLAGYLDPEYPYRFAHLRRFDVPSLRLLLDRVMVLEVLEWRRVYGTAFEVVIAARKPVEDRP